MLPKRVERLGSARTIKVDVRVIAATNKNLEEEIEKGHFREDLYFRLAVIPIHVPPLAQATGGHSTAGAALHGVLRPRQQHATQTHHARQRWSAATSHRWKGNIRELSNTRLSAS